jgi:hypothetical protein
MRRIASDFEPGPQASPNIPEMTPCNVSADLPMAACITYELLGYRDEGVSAINRHRVALKSQG